MTLIVKNVSTSRTQAATQLLVLVQELLLREVHMLLIRNTQDLRLRGLLERK